MGLTVALWGSLGSVAVLNLVYSSTLTTTTRSLTFLGCGVACFYGIWLVLRMDGARGGDRLEPDTEKVVHWDLRRFPLYGRWQAHESRTPPVKRKTAEVPMHHCLSVRFQPVTASGAVIRSTSQMP